jgi:hypothetical protein
MLYPQHLQWPEVLRELAVAATVTHEKPRPKKSTGGGKGGYAGSKPKLGEAGEDLGGWLGAAM